MNKETGKYYLNTGLIIINSIGKQTELTFSDATYHFEKGFTPIYRPWSDLKDGFNHKGQFINNAFGYLHITDIDDLISTDGYDLNISFLTTNQLIEWHFNVSNEEDCIYTTDKFNPYE